MLKSIIKKLTATIMFFAFVCLPATAFASGLVKPADVTGGNGDGHSGGSNIYFGQYWQSYKGSGATDDKANYNYEGIKWRVLANNSKKDINENMGLLLLSDQALYADALNTLLADGNTWNSSEARQTLGSMSAKGADAPVSYSDLDTGFAKDAFSATEYNAIATTDHVAGHGIMLQSKDKVFVLSLEEASDRYNLYGFGGEATVSNNKRKTSPTALARYVKMYGNSSTCSLNEGNVNWWLRSPGFGDDEEDYVDYNGIYDCDAKVSSVNYSVRPALNLASFSILFLSAATGGKSTVAVGSGFVLADYTGHDYKVTIKDSSLSKPTVTLKINNEKLDGTFSGASTGAKKYLSVWLLDADRKSVNYAKLANCSSAGFGNFSALSFANVPDGKYILQFFSEEANGDYLSDYASEVYEQSVSVYGGKVTQLNPPMPTIDKTKAEFDKNAPADITFTLTNVAHIVKVTLGNEEISQYSYADGTFTLLKEALISKATGDYLLTIKTDNGTLEATVTVKDSSSPEPEPTATPSSGGGGGCNAGFGAFALLMALPLFCRKKK